MHVVPIGMGGAQQGQVMAYLKSVISRIGENPEKWRCEVVSSSSFAKGIVDFAATEQVDLIAMFTHDRKGIAKMIKGSVTQEVQKMAVMEVHIVKP